MNAADWVAIFAALPGVTALILLWRYSHANRNLIRKVIRRVNDHELTLAQTRNQSPQLLDVPTMNGDELT